MTHQRPLGDIAKLIRGISFPKDSKSLEPRPGDVACLRTANVQRQVEWGDLWFVPAEHVKRQEQYVQPGDILISTANSYNLVGKVAFVTAPPHKSTLGAFISLIRPSDEVEPKFLYHQLAWGQTQQRIRETASTTTNISNVSTKKLAGLELLLPSLDEQGRIVAEIEKQFSRLDEAVANLKRVKANLKRYKAAVLKAAVEGRLVETEAELARREGRSYETGAQLLQRILETRRSQWQGKGKYKEPAAPDTTDLPELPEGWVWASPAQLSAGEPYSLAIGPFGSSLKVSDYTNTGVPLVFVRNIRAASFGGPETVFVTAEKAEELRAHRVDSGDLLVTKMGDPPGDVCIYPTHMPAAVITADCIKLRLSNGLALTQFYAYAIESDQVHKQILGITKGVAQLKVSLGRFGSIGLPLPPLAEQERITAEVDRRLTLLRNTGAQVEANLQRAVRLRGAILRREFSGSSCHRTPIHTKLRSSDVRLGI